LATWANQGGTVGAKATHESIRLALSDPGSTVRGRAYEVYLQGSYKNDTNIYGDMDVDVLVQLNEIFYYDIDYLELSEAQLFHNDYPNGGTANWFEFRSAVMSSLQNYYGSDAVTPSENCLKLAAPPYGIPADVVPCAQLRRYVAYPTSNGGYFYD